jgi:chemotaxis response regulator CheB
MADLDQPMLTRSRCVSHEVPFYEGDPGSPNYDVAADDQRFIIVLPASTGGPDRLNVVLGCSPAIWRPATAGIP